MPKVLPYIPTSKLPTSLDPVEAKFSVALFVPIGIPREDEWRRKITSVYWNCNLQHWTDKTAGSMRRYVSGTIEWQLHQKFTAGSKQHLQRLDEFFEWQKRETEKDRRERRSELEEIAKRTVDASCLERMRHTAAVYDGVAKARKANDSPVALGGSVCSPPWTDESKQLAVARSGRPQPRSLFAKRRSTDEFLEMVDRKVRKAARNGPRSFSVVEFGDYLLRDDDGDSLQGHAKGPPPGKETESEREEREAIEADLKELACEEQRGWTSP